MQGLMRVLTNTTLGAVSADRRLSGCSDPGSQEPGSGLSSGPEPKPRRTQHQDPDEDPNDICKLQQQCIRDIIQPSE